MSYKFDYKTFIDYGVGDLHHIKISVDTVSDDQIVTIYSSPELMTEGEIDYSVKRIKEKFDLDETGRKQLDSIANKAKEELKMASEGFRERGRLNK